ncbi:MAG: serine hydrolase [Bacteroidota bacterium]
MQVYLLFSLLVVVVSLFFSCDKKTQVNHSEKTFDSLLVMQKESWNLPGVVLGIIKNDEVVYSKAFGVRGIDTNDSLTVKSVFHMASVSKPFVATAIMQLVEDGKVELDGRLIDYVPYFKMADDRYKLITIRHILNHSSGIPDVEDYEWHKPQYDDGAAERYAQSFVDTYLDFNPGTQYSYSNAAFDILANVISRASGMTFEEYMKKNIFEPAGMKNSTFFKPEVPEELATKPHVLGDSLQITVSEVYPYNRRHAPSSTLNSNVEDMLKWAQVNLNKGEINGNRIYSELSYDLLTQPQFKAEGRDSICLSWFAHKLGDYRVVNHGGGDTGYLTDFAFIPGMNAALVMMANNDFYWSGDASRILLQKLVLERIEKEWQIPIHYKLKDYILDEGIEKCKEVYFKEKKDNPEKYVFEGRYLDEFGYQLLYRGHKKEALQIFKFHVELEPDNATYAESLAEGYLALNETEEAIKWYQKAVEINPDQEYSKKKLMELRINDKE